MDDDMDEISVNLTPDYLIDMLESKFGLTVDQFSKMATEREELIDKRLLKQRSSRKIFNATSQPSTSDAEEEITVDITPKSCEDLAESIYGDLRVFHYLQEAHNEKMAHKFPKIFGHFKKPDGPVQVAPPMRVADPKKPLLLPEFLLMENLSPFFSRKQFYELWLSTDIATWESGQRGLAMMMGMRNVTNFDNLSVEQQRSVLNAAKKYKDCIVIASRMMEEKRAFEKTQQENNPTETPMEH